MLEAKFICSCGFSFQEPFQDNEAVTPDDPEVFYARCPRCGEEVRTKSLEPVGDRGWRR